MRNTLRAAALAVLAAGGWVSAAGNQIYWTQPDYYNGGPGRVLRAPIDEFGNVETVLTGVRTNVLAVGGGKLYWGADADLLRSDVDGSGVETLVAGTWPQALALDLAGGKLYWTSGTPYDPPARVHRADLDGSEAEILIDDHPLIHGDALYGLALDVAGGKLYFTDYSWGDVYRADLDGTSLEDLGVPGDLPAGIALDLEGGKMYWANGDWCIFVANLDGSDAHCFIGATNCAGTAWYVAIDAVKRELYWSEAWCDTGIWRKGLDGGDLENVVPGQAAPFNLAIAGGCGNGSVEPGEECDDGNADDGDGCSSSCAVEPPVVPAVSSGAALATVLLAATASAALLRRRP